MNTYEISDDGSAWDQQIFAPDAEAALEEARSMVTWDDYSCESTSTMWISVTVKNVNDEDDTDSGTVTLHPPAPSCEDGQEHDWQSPHCVVGGLEENPGVQGKGGGVICQEVCVHCGCGRVSDTWAQDSHGRQGLSSVKYDPDYLEDGGYSVKDGKFVRTEDLD